MGISWHEAKALVELYRRNGPLGRTATVGRQCLYFDPRLVTRMFSDAGAVPQGLLSEFLKSASFFAEGFFRLCGATEIVSFDYSDFEGASVCHDMNKPIASEYHNAFDLVYDGGSLEHVFNFPVSVKNCMLMLKESGILAMSTPANNFMGHGFYQFSPELFFRIFSEENGFCVERMIAFDYREAGPWYEVADPRKLGKRVELWGTGQRVELWVLARKMRTLDNCLEAPPQQSDYQAMWADPRGAAHASYYPSRSGLGLRGQLAALLDKFSPSLLQWFQEVRSARAFQQEIKRRDLRFNKEAFKRIEF